MSETKKPIPRTYLHVDPEIFKVLYLLKPRKGKLWSVI